MTPRMFRPGEYETSKAVVHLALLGLAGVCAGYNLVAWAFRRDTHLAVNASVYTVLALLEFKQVGRHRDSARHHQSQSQ